jgi:ubiquinone biosynthesis accessory factor UbiK
MAKTVCTALAPDIVEAFVKLRCISFNFQANVMLKQNLAREVAGKVSEILANSPARDVEKNLKASLAAWLSKLDLVTREEFDVQSQVLARTRATLQQLEARLARLESGSDRTPEA